MGTTSEGPFQLEVPSYPRGIIFGDTSQPSQTIFEESATQQYTLGTPLVYADGRKFRYSKAGAALSKAYMTCGATVVGNVQAETQTTSGANVDVLDQEIVIDVTAASGITDDLYAEGFLTIDSSTAVGDIYKIVACKLLTTTTARLLLETKIRTNWSATTVISLHRNRWRDVVVYPATATQPATGIPLIDVTSAYFFWAQTGGDAPCYCDTDDSLIAGEPVGKPGTQAVAGTCGIVGAGPTDEIWGTVRYIQTGGNVALINLRLD